MQLFSLLPLCNLNCLCDYDNTHVNCGHNHSHIFIYGDVRKALMLESVDVIVQKSSKVNLRND